MVTYITFSLFSF